VPLLAACVGSARDASDYTQKAVATTEHVRSSVRTVQLAIDAADGSKAFPTYLARVISQSEDDASAALNGFESIQPPGTDSDQLRDEVKELSSDAIDLMATARIAIRRNDIDVLTALRSDIQNAGDQLEQFGQDHHA
jgi:hypothetical protein